LLLFLAAFEPFEAAMAREFKLVPSRIAIAGGVIVAKRPAFLRNSRLALSSEHRPGSVLPAAFLLSVDMPHLTAFLGERS
jgi:hypothetical protein